MRQKSVWFTWFALAVFAIPLACAAGPGPVVPDPDPLMGDWEGVRKLENGPESRLVAQVIALGKGKYRANLLEKFDARDVTVAVLEGEKKGDEAVLQGKSEKGDLAGATWKATLNEKSFSGTFSRDVLEGAFSLEKVVRLSPTLGAEPPENAVVLFSGTELDKWFHPGRHLGIIDLRRLMNKENVVAYMRATIVSPKEQKVRIEIGSDDGVKAWLNGEEILSQNVTRGLAIGQDKVDATLKEGANQLMLKVTQGTGTWAAAVRVVSPDGKPIPTLHTVPVEPKQKMDQPSEKSKKGVMPDSFVVDWQVSGPYAEKGKNYAHLFDIAFAPEKPDQKADWRDVAPPLDPSVAHWNLVEGDAMEVNPGTGSIMSKQEFGDQKLHVEFRTPFMPEARGQSRGNSGVYLQGRYEVQVLDSYGLEGADNECGGIYKVGRPRVNMCAPPLQWQTYDITFFAPKFDENGKKIKDAKITVIHNGVTIHENMDIPGPTGGAVNADESKPGGLLLQDHGNPVRYRNIWVAPLKAEK